MKKIKTLKTTKILVYILVGVFLLYMNTAEISYSKSLSPEKYIQEGKSLLEKGEYEQSLQKLAEAEAYFKSVQVKSKNERLSEIYFLQGLNFSKQGNEKISKEMFKRALHYSSDREYDTALMDEVTKEVFTKAKIEFEEGISPKAMGMQGESYRKKGGSAGWIALAVIAIVAVGVLAYFLVKELTKEEDEGPDTGSIQVNSNPTGAAISLDGQDTGKTTNATLTDVAPGSHTLKLVKQGYKVWQDTVTVNKGETTHVNVTLEEEPRVGSIQANSNPSGAAISLDGQDTGKTTPDRLNNVSVGAHTVKLVKERYQDWQDTVNVTENTTTTVNATLEVGAFTEDFNDGVADYFVEDHPASWNVDANVYKFDGTGASVNTFSYYDLGGFADFTLEVRGNRETYNSRWGVGFRATSNFTRWHLVYLDPAAGKWGMWEYDDGSWTSIQGYIANGAINTGADQWNKIKIVALGEDFSVYVNDVFLDTLTVAGVRSSGKIGLVTNLMYDFVKFDDVSVSLSTTIAVKGRRGKIAFPIPGGNPDRR